MTPFRVDKDTRFQTYPIAIISDSSEASEQPSQTKQLLTPLIRVQPDPKPATRNAVPSSDRQRLNLCLAHHRPQVRAPSRWLMGLLPLLAFSFPPALFSQGSPSLSIGRSSVAFGWVFIGTPATQPVTLTSNGTAAVTVSAATAAGAGFTVSGASFPFTLNPGRSVTLEVEFNPIAAAAVTGELTIASNSSTGATTAIGLSGTGTPVVSALSCGSASMTGAGTDTCTVTLNAAAAAGGRNVVLSSNNAAVKVPPWLIVPANAVSAPFTATVSSFTTAQSAILTAVAGGVSASFGLQLNPPVTATVPAANGFCTITGTGTILANGALGGSPLLGDVYQIQGTITADYVDDDEVGNSTLVVTAPDGSHTVTSGLFLLNAHANGLNAYAARVAAGYESSGVWAPGAWTWQMNLRDRAGNTCTSSGSYVVSSTWDDANGFLRQYADTPNFVTDGNNQAFWPTGIGWYFPFYNGTDEVYNDAEIPALAYVNVNGTDVSYVSGTPFSTQTLPAGVTNQIYICPSPPGNCTPYWDVTINSSSDLTLPASGGNLGNVQAYLGFARDLSIGNRPLGYQTSLANTAQFLAAWGTNFDRYADDQFGQLYGSFLATGYNTYNYNAATGASKWGLPAIDLWFAAAHAAGIHLLFGGPWYSSNGAYDPCPNYVCSAAEELNLQRFYAMIAARYGAFYDILELSNEVAPPQTWTDAVGTVLTQGVAGINGGAPADPYGHFFTLSYFPNDPLYYSPTYGPFSSGDPDSYLNLVDLPHIDSAAGQTIYSYQAGQETDKGGCPGTSGYGGTTLPRIDDEEATQLGVAPPSASATAPNDEVNGPRIVDEANVLNQCGGATFNPISDIMVFNSVTPFVASSWYDVSIGRTLLQSFMKNLDPAAAPLAVTLGGGCAGGKCSYAALGSSSHIRLELDSNSGNAGTAVPNPVTAGTVTLNVPQPGMTGKWWNTENGTIIGTITTSATTGAQTFTAPNFNVDMWFQLDP